MSRLPWMLGGGAITAYLLLRGSTPTPRPRLPGTATPGSNLPQPPRIDLEGRWVWPVPPWQQRPPVISDGFGSPRPGRLHAGVDVMFLRAAADAATLRAGTPNGSRGFVMPNGVSALAAADGVVWSAGQGPRGFSVVIDHGKHHGQPVATFYTHLEKLAVTPTQRGQTKQQIRAGQPLGIIGGDPLDPQKLKHLHFELWLGGPANAIDPIAIMRGWTMTAPTTGVLV